MKKKVNELFRETMSKPVWVIIQENLHDEIRELKQKKKKKNFVPSCPVEK